MNSRILYDEAYRTRRAEGRPGWTDKDTLSDNLNALEQELECPHAPPTGRVLELGCGAGDFSLLLASKGYETHGIDISPVAIEWAREKAKERDVNVQFRVGNVLNLNAFSDDHFDFVLDGYCFHCITGEDRLLFLANARRVMKHRAVFHVRTMCGDISNPHLNISPNLSMSFDSSSRCVLNKDGVASRYIGLPGAILAEVRTAGFDLLHSRVAQSTGRVDDMDTLLLWAAK